MGRSNGICNLCRNDNEDLLRLLYSCPLIYRLWSLIENKINAILNKNMSCDFYTILLGYCIKEKEMKHKENICNCIIQETKWQIWLHRNNVRYGNKDIERVEVLYNRIIRKCKNDIQMLCKKVKQTDDIREVINIHL